jgi:hypothetical protein
MVSITEKKYKRNYTGMQWNGIKKLTYADIGYHGKPIDTLTREELLEAYLELVQDN